MGICINKGTHEHCLSIYILQMILKNKNWYCSLPFLTIQSTSGWLRRKKAKPGMYWSGCVSPPASRRRTRWWTERRFASREPADPAPTDTENIIDGWATV
jgi:hypothetical protein